MRVSMMQSHDALFCNPQVGKEHLDQQMIRSKKQVNGMHSTKDVPTVIVVGTNEQQSSSSSHQKSPQSAVKCPNAKAKMSMETGKISRGSHSHQKEMSADEVDSLRGPIVPEIKVSTKMSKPEII